MSSSFGGLNTVVRGLAAQQTSLNTVGHNVSNANTIGYSRQNVNLTTTRPEIIYGNNGQNQLGTGVDIGSIARARDTFIDKQMWKETSSLGYGQTAADTLARVEGVFHEPSETGLQTTLDKFWTSLQTLATNASDDGMRTVVRQRGVEIVDAIQHATTQLTDMVADANAVIEIKVNNINQLSSEIFALNRQIVNIETGGRDHANDLRDRRDVLVDEMSKIVNINVTEDKYGNYNIQSASVTLVDGVGYQKLEAKKRPGGDADYGYEVVDVVAQGSTQPLNFKGGELRGLLEMRDSVAANNSYDGLKGYIQKLDNMSQFLLQDFNKVHKAGVGTDDSTGQNFFGDEDYTGFTPTAGTMGWIKELKVNPDLFDPVNGLNLIAAKTSIGLGDAAGDNAVNLANSLKVDGATALGGRTPDSFYSSVIGALGVQAQSANRLTDNQKTLVSQITNWRESVSGVNMDEEMSNMIRFQKGYAAAARVLTSMDEMLDKLINSTGVVGR
ncbi:MAG: flagellar hook-associated protein FlgK [Sporomusaceae bacterium]|nr:flagellar hook-associated protein FlgK [Sporomusaceae bacterium]